MPFLPIDCRLCDETAVISTDYITLLPDYAHSRPATMAPFNKPKHKGKALVAGASAGIFGKWDAASLKKLVSFSSSEYLGFRILFLTSASSSTADQSKI